MGSFNLCLPFVKGVDQTKKTQTLKLQGPIIDLYFSIILHIYVNISLLTFLPFLIEEPT